MPYTHTSKDIYVFNIKTIPYCYRRKIIIPFKSQYRLLICRALKKKIRMLLYKL